MEWLIFITPGIAFLVLAALWFRVRFRYQAPADDPPGVRSVVQWMGRLMEGQDEPTAGDVAALLVSGLRQRSLTAEEPTEREGTWAFVAHADNIAFHVRHSQPEGLPRQTISRPVKVFFDTPHIRAWKRMSAAIGEILDEQGAREVNWIRYEDHWNDAVEWAFDDPVD